MSGVDHEARLGRVEGEVQTVRTEVSALTNEFSGLKSDVKGLGSILTRIEQGVANAQQQWQDDKQASRLNPIALMGVLITIISIIVGGAWLISGQLASTSTRLEDSDKSIGRMIEMRDRELDLMEKRLDRVEDHHVASPPSS
jgi:hypothetical protein